MEFNSLSVVYQKPSERFLKETELKQSIASEKKYFPERKKKIKLREKAAGLAEEGEGEEESTVTESLLDTNASTSVNTTAQPGGGLDDLLGLGPPSQPTPAATQGGVDDLLGMGPSQPTN